MQIRHCSYAAIYYEIYTTLHQNIPHGSLATTVLANNTGSDGPILLTALMRNLYSLFGVKSSHLNFVG